MIIKEVEVKTFAKIVECECGGITEEIKRDFSKEIPLVKLKCLSCGKEEEINLNDLNLRYEIIK